MVEETRAIARTRFRIGGAIALKYAFLTVSSWLLIWGVTVFILRAAFGIAPHWLIWGWLGLIPALGIALALAIRRMPSPSTVRALLDHHGNYGGLLMSAAEADAGAWPVKAQTPARLKIRWDGRRASGILLCSVCFLLLGFLLPARLLNKAAAERLMVDAEVEKLAEKIELLQEESVLPPERAESLEQALDQLQRDAKGNDPAKTWEAMDHLEQSISQASAEAAENAARDARQAAANEEVASALDQARTQMGNPELTAAMQMLAENVSKMAEENGLLDQELSEELKEQLKQGHLSPEDLQKLAESLGKCKSGQLGKLKKLSIARMIDPALLKKCEGECKGDPKALAALLAKCQGGKATALCIGSCQKPGRGGISRGRGDAAMTWTDGVNRDDMEFKESALPPGAATSLKDARLQAISIGNPSADQPAGPTSGGGLDLSTAGQGSARTQVILPEHKKVVQRYFSRTPAGSAASPGTP